MDGKSLKRSGERGRNRTYNLLIKSQLLCQLSYAPDRESLGSIPALCEIHSRQLFDCTTALNHSRTASFGANDAAAICAISRSLGGVAETPASASRNIVLQN